MKKYALYLRVSTDEQQTANQKLTLIQFAQKMQFEYEIIEEVESSKNTRPKKQQLLNDLRKKKYEGVIVYKLDRWARSSRELLLEVEELTQKGIQFISYTENLDFTTAVGKLQFNILSAFAEFERDLIRQRTMEGLKRAKSEGKKLGRPKGSKDSKKRRKIGYYENKNALILNSKKGGVKTHPFEGKIISE